MQQIAHQLYATTRSDGELSPSRCPAHFLVVQPSAALRTLLRSLPTAGCRFHVTECGAAAALVQCLTSPPDLVVLDLDGSSEASLALCTQLRQRSLVPIVAWTTAWQVDRLVQVLAQGADDLLDAFARRA